MTNGEFERVLAFNAGSSSLKVRVYRLDDVERPELSAEVDRIGSSGGRLTFHDDHGGVLVDRGQETSGHDDAARALLAELGQTGVMAGLIGSGHRIVHGSRDHTDPELVTKRLLTSLAALIPLAPDHLPGALAVLTAVHDVLPGLPMVACFDTAFHSQMPGLARRFALPRALGEGAILRYGFHGLSCESIMAQLARRGVRAPARLIIAHLGNGSSMTAVRDGQSIDTTMGFTPAGGLMMGTRCGDLDPGVLIYLLRTGGLGADALDELVNERAGLLGVSETSADMRDLLERESEDSRAADAIALFCYQARKHLGALIAVLGGLDCLVFTGGIGEHAAPVRERICADLDYLGIHVAATRNDAGASIISTDDSSVTVLVIKTDEERIIAQHTMRVLRQGDRHALHV